MATDQQKDDLYENKGHQSIDGSQQEDYKALKEETNTK